MFSSAMKSDRSGVQLGDLAPDFAAASTKGPFHFHAWLGSCWCALFSYPRDFSPVCTTELGEAARRAVDFRRRGVRLLALGAGSVGLHRRWIADVEEALRTKIDYPLIGDEDGKIAALYGMPRPRTAGGETVRRLFVIDPAKRIRLTMTYPATTGRSFDEILRVIDALQLTDGYGVATPAGWKNGDPCLIPPAIQDPVELQRKFPKGFKTLKPYLRLTPQPNR